MKPIVDDYSLIGLTPANRQRVQQRLRRFGLDKIDNGGGAAKGSGPGTGEEIVVTPDETTSAVEPGQTEPGKPPLEEVELPEDEAAKTSGDGDAKSDESDESGENRLEVE